MKNENLWALFYKFGDSSWEQLDLFEEPKNLWVGPLFYPSDLETPEDVAEEFVKTLPGRAITAKVTGKYERKGEENTWQLIPLQ